MGTMLIGYDVEWRGEGDITPRFLEQARSLHNRLKVPATLFVVGQTLERWVPQFQAIADDHLFDIQQHTYSHQLLKTVYIEDGRSVRVVRGVSVEETRDEVAKTSSLLAELLGVPCIGLTGPWCYYRGLRDRPDILEVLWEEGIRFTRTDGRNERDWHPVSMDLQPYWYDVLGFPDVLEIPIHGWHDCVIRDEVLGWDDVDGYVESVKPYIDRAAAEDKVFSLCQHDWSSIRADPQMGATEALIRYAQERDLRIMSYREYYDECDGGRADAVSATLLETVDASR
jgi:peptidoglycan/xylan/chitin deacetylase (PgdA/CDA1 family)